MLGMYGYLTAFPTVGVLFIPIKKAKKECISGEINTNNENILYGFLERK